METRINRIIAKGCFIGSFCLIAGCTGSDFTLENSGQEGIMTRSPTKMYFTTILVKKYF